MDASEYINLRTLSKRLGVANRTLRNWISDPNLKLPAYRIKGCLRFNWAEIEEWLEDYKVKTVDTTALEDEILIKFTKGENDESE